MRSESKLQRLVEASGHAHSATRPSTDIYRELLPAHDTQDATNSTLVRKMPFSGRNRQLQLQQIVVPRRATLQSLTIAVHHLGFKVNTARADVGRYRAEHALLPLATALDGQPDCKATMSATFQPRRVPLNPRFGFDCFHIVLPGRRLPPLPVTLRSSPSIDPAMRPVESPPHQRPPLDGSPTSQLARIGLSRTSQTNDPQDRQSPSLTIPKHA